MDVLTHILRTIAARYPAIKDEIPAVEEDIRRQYGSERHYIASAEALNRTRRDADIRRQHNQNGVPVADLATRYRLTPRQVRNILSAPENGNPAPY